jgi:hypothetical protein
MWCGAEQAARRLPRNLAGGLVDERGDFRESEAKNEHRMRSNAAPAGELPFGAEETDFGFHG